MTLWITKKLANTYFILLLYAIFLFTSCQLNNTEKVTSKLYSGKDLFSSIFFLNGNALEKIPQLFTMKTGMLKYEQVRYYFENMDSAATSLLIENIHHNEPLFFGEFQKEIQSGDHFRIQMAMDKGTQVLANASTHLYEKSMNELIEVIQFWEEEELTARLGGELIEDIKYIESIQSDPALLKKFLLIEFIKYSKANDSARETRYISAKAIVGEMVAVAAALYFAGGVTFDVFLGMNDRFAMNYAYIVNFCFLDGRPRGYKDQPRPQHPKKRMAKNQDNLQYEMLINEIAENLKLK